MQNVQNAISGGPNRNPNRYPNQYPNQYPNHNGHHTHGIISNALGTTNSAAQQALHATGQITHNVHNFLGNTIDKLTGGRDSNIINSGLNKVVDASNGITQTAQNLAAGTIDTVVGGTQSFFGKLGSTLSNWGRK